MPDIMNAAWKLWLLAAPALLVFAFACGDGADEAEGPDGDAGEPVATIPVPSPFPGITSEVVVPNAETPVALAFTPDGRLFYNERDTGNVRIVTTEGRLLPEPFVHVDVAVSLVSALEPGWGLLGLALDPDFESNQYVYVYFTQPGTAEDKATPVVVRFTDVDNLGVDPKTIVGDLPEATIFTEYFVGGQMRFGPDGYLYIAIGDFIDTDLAQDLDSVRGKILRIDKEDGSPAPDNPFADDPEADPRVFAYGFLNAYDFTFQPQTGELFATEYGLYFCCDELNIVRQGQNYGWPQSGADQTDTLPIHFFSLPGQTSEGTKVAPTGIEFVSGADNPALGDSLLVCEGRTKFMRRLVLAPNQNQVQSDDVVVADCSRDIAVSPDGQVYYSNDSEIRRLVADSGAAPAPSATPTP